MTKKLLLKFFLLFLLLSAQLTNGQNYTPLVITSGFNEDVIAEDKPASTHTTAAVDATSSGANNAFMSINYPNATVGLPANGLITSISTGTPGLTFQLAPYNQNNSLKINANNGTGTLAVQTTNKLVKLYILATSGSSTSTFTGTITFTDGATQTFSSQSVPDWYDQGTPAIAIQGIGRVPRTGTENPDNNTTNPKLFQVAIDISSTNQNKIIQQVAITKTSSTSGFLNIFALSGEITPTCIKPDALGIQNLTATSVDLTWTSPGTTFDIKWGERNFNVTTAGTLVTGFANGGTLSGLTADTNYDYYVRRDCDAVDGVSAWAGPFQFRTGYCIPTGATNNSDEIRNFKLSNLNNNSTASEGTAGYKDYSGTVEPAILEIGEAYVASLTSGSGSGTHGAAIWIDYNNNLIFEANEKVSIIGNTISSSTTVNFPSFTVPATIQPGIYRLRVQYQHNKSGADLDPCTIASIYAETEDYAVQIMPAPTCFPPLNVTAQRITKNSAQVVWEAPILGNPPALGYKIEVRTSGRPGDATGLVQTLTTTNLSQTITGLSVETEYLIYVQSLCATTDESTWSRISFTTLCNHPDYELTTSASDLSFCGSREVTLEVNTQGTVNWFNSATSTTPIHTGNTYTTTVSATSSFWYQVSSLESATVPTGPLNAAAVSTSSGNWGTEWDVYFTILEPTKLKSIDIYPSTAGQTGRMTFKQRGATGSATVGTINYTTVGANRTVKQVVPIDLQLLPGTYVIETTLPSDGMLRNTSGASYPYSSAVASITGNEYLPSYYMGYYNWIFETGCKSLREEVVVIVNDVPDMPVSSATLTYIYGDIATAITAVADINNSLLWYTTETGGTGSNIAPTPTTDVVGTQTFWVSQVTADGCESERTKIEVVINQATLTITADANQSKGYGETDPVLTYTVSGYQHSDDNSILSGALSRIAGENVGTYAIEQGTLTAGDNYDIVFISNDFTINKATLTITADANQSKGYGETDPVLTYTVSGYQHSDDNSILSGALSRIAGENVGTYAIEQGTLTAGNNYDIVFVSDDFTINKATLTITADANQSKGYGNADPVLTYTVSGYQHSDDNSILSGALSRAAGEDVGTYAIEQSTLTAGNNYDIVFVSDDFTINKATLTITADSGQSKVYGETDPVLTYTVSGYQRSDDNSILSGALSRIAGEDVGTYAIEQGTLTAGDNYDIVFVSNDFTINKATLTITADSGQSKVYGETDPVLTYTDSGYQGSDDNSILSGALSRAAGENVGTYAIEQGTLTAGDNYDIVFISNDFTINKATLTITADSGQSKVYGETDPVLTYTVSGYQRSDDNSILSGALTRVAGENVGTYAIEQGTLTAGDNYDIVFISNDFTINKATLTITADSGQSKVYGETDPVLTYTVSGYQRSDDNSILSGALTRVAGENVGTYAIEQGTLTAGDNYDIVFVSNDFTINKATLTITADVNQSKMYGETDPVLTYTDSGYQHSDDNSILSGALSRIAGENVGTYAIEQGTLTAGDNYDIVFVSDDFTINKATLTITADSGQSKVYGETDPVLTYTVSGYQGTDDNSILSGALSRVAGEDVGTYVIEQGTLTAGDNYDIVFVSDDFTINKATLTITADSGQSKVYGETDPVLTYTVSGYQRSDDNSILSGALSRAAGENVGTYAIEQGTLTAGDNYDIVFVSNDFTITKATLTITPHSGQGKTYGSTNPVYPYDILGFVLGDTAAVINGALGRQSGENVGTYLYNAGSLTAQNYTFVIIEEYFAITPAPIEVHVNPGQSKAYGAADPVLTYTANGLVNGDTQANAFTGSLQRVPGENTGVYAIKQGTLQPNANYQLTSFTGADFEIKKAVITGIKLESATFVYDGTPKSLYLTGNIQPGAQVSYTGNGQTEAGEYTVTATVDYGSNYEILVLTAKLKIVQAEQVIDFELNSPVILEYTTPFQLDATASSGLAVYYSFNYIENHPAMVSSDGHVELIAPGTVEITAHQDGNNNYKAAQPVTRTLVVESRDSSIWKLYIDGEKYENPSEQTLVIKGCDDTDSPFVEIEVETQAGATVSPSEVIVVPTPEYGTYEVEIIVTSPNGKHSQTYKVIIEKRLPWEGVLMQKYDNLVFVNNNPATNGGHKFVRYQWYKNGAKVADHKVFSEGAAMDDILDPEAEYHAVLYTQDGQVLTTCTMGVRLRHDYALSVYPNPIAKKQSLNVRVDDPKEAFEQSDYSIYSQTGQLIQRGKLTQALSAIGLPPTIQAGTYILVLKIDGEHKSVHFVVKP